MPSDVWSSEDYGRRKITIPLPISLWFPPNLSWHHSYLFSSKSHFIESKHLLLGVLSVCSTLFGRQSSYPKCQEINIKRSNCLQTLLMQLNVNIKSNEWTTEFMKSSIIMNNKKQRLMNCLLQSTHSCQEITCGTHCDQGIDSKIGDVEKLGRVNRANHFFFFTRWIFVRRKLEFYWSKSWTKTGRKRQLVFISIPDYCNPIPLWKKIERENSSENEEKWRKNYEKLV